MKHSDIMTLSGLRTIAEAHNRILERIVHEAAKVIPYDLASDYIYEVIDIERVKQEMENGKDERRI